MNLTVLASGSKANSALIRAGDTRILVDAGLSVRELTKRLAQLGEAPEGLDAVLVTHEHGDHVAGLLPLIRSTAKRGRAVPVYLTEATAAMIDWRDMEAPPVKYFRPGSRFAIGEVGVSSFTTPHDCADPVCFTFESAGEKLGFAIDLGYVPDAVRIRFRGCQTVFVESNYDTVLCETGDYPECVKRRVMGPTGHLSNADVQDFIAKDLDVTALQTLVLGHLSEGNNRKELVVDGAAEAIARRNVSPRLLVASQHSVLQV